VADGQLAGAGAGSRRQLTLTLLVAGTFFMEILDGTILSTAAPSMARYFEVDSAAISTTITAYLLTLAVLIPLSGWLTERFGVRLIFLAAIVIFTVASALCAASTGLIELTIMRVIQGIGGAMMVPVGRLAVLRVTSKVDLVRAVALLTWPALVAPIFAPLVGGILTTYATWQWIFLINVPLGVIAFLVGLRVVPHHLTGTHHSLDLPGLILTCVGLGSLVYLASLLAEDHPDATLVIVSAVTGAVFTAGAIVRMRTAAHPLLDLRSFRIETFRVTHAGGSLFRLTISAMPFLLPLFFQDALGWSPVEAGAVVLFLFVGNLAIKPATTPLLRRFGFRTVLLASTAGAVASMALVALVNDASPIFLVAVLLCFGGVARSVGFTAYNTIAFADIPDTEMTSANTLASTVQQVASGFGVAVGALALTAGRPLAALVGAGTEVSAFHVAFLIIAVLALVPVIESIVLSRDAGSAIRPQRRVAAS
jgi:EmrB/QacA subfamily drug resistance transporter